MNEEMNCQVIHKEEWIHNSTSSDPDIKYTTTITTRDSRVAGLIEKNIHKIFKE